jgi:hypothetical protein
LGIKNRKNSGNIDSSISVLLLEAARLPEQQGDTLMRIILAGVVLATLMASPLLAQSQSTEGPPHSGAHLDQKKQLRVGYRDLGGAAPKSNQPASKPDPRKQGLCSTAPGLCPDYHGGNGG